MIAENLTPIPRPLPRIQVWQLRQMKTKVQKCCNYFEGNCLLLEDGDEVCPQSVTKTVVCRWFYHGVLPPAIKEKPTRTVTSKIRACQICGKPYEAKSNNSKYCKQCAKTVRRHQTREHVRKHRSVSKLTSQNR